MLVTQCFEPIEQKPVGVFQSERQLNMYCRMWQNYLYLNDWCIAAYFRDCIKDDDGNELAGKNEFQVVNMTASVLIKDLREDIDAKEGNYFMKMCQEQVLVHGLLHCKMNVMQAPYSYEGKYCDVYEHQELERMANTLIACAYHLPPKWYDNTDFLLNKRFEEGQKNAKD